jgi:hypothetical protein
MRNFYLPILFQLITLTAFSQNFQMGDKVEAYNSGAWYKAKIVQIGTDNYAGYYYVKYDDYNQSQWIKETNIKLQKPATAQNNNGPRNGLYIILSYGNPSAPIRIGYFELANGEYTYYTLGKKVIGKGTYAYNSENKTVQWKTGPFKDANWGGSFEIDREGKTHKIRLNRATIGSNSTDSN